jgi:hypothetical protein
MGPEVADLPHGIGPSVANNSLKVIADVECKNGMGLPSSNILIRGSRYGYDKKLDTYGSP